MAKAKKVFICSSCGYQTPKWLGRCPSCGEWNTLEEGAMEKATVKATVKTAQTASALSLSAIEAGEELRWDTGWAEVNQVLGGGLVQGSAILIGGEPGIGKSTLLLQVLNRVKVEGPVLYISGEESPRQIKLRATRLGIDRSNLVILSESRLERIEKVLEKEKPSVVVVDSIQTLFSPEAGQVPGTVNQLKLTTFDLISWAKERSVGILLVAHVTKGGEIAGPKAVEHMVDTVLMFEQGQGDLRVLRAMKNRFGSVDELGLFTMEQKGLVEIKNPEGRFLVERTGELPPGTVVAPVYEGTRILLVELQALTVPAKGAVSRVFSDRIDSGRVSRIAAVLEKHLGLRFSDLDIYINVAGGIRIAEVGVELALAMALYSARTGLSLPKDLGVMGEVSLAGEIRSVSQMERRKKALKELGYSNLVFPHTKGQKEGMRHLKDVIARIYGNTSAKG
jgi:DNA repair protein RadA/Sms